MPKGLVWLATVIAGSAIGVAAGLALADSLL